ncbi:MAG TPA: sigma factor-like helix-turn-helix DNA-binding protein [Allosphingosinicella sp.]|nr:sigma factor-like helix-turn-helix DNA-binding protein [Allosphingosinicella sp.]
MANDRAPVDAGRLARAAACLRPDEREALALHAQGDLSSKEIAAALGMSEAALEPLVARALLKLDRALDRLDRPWWRFW